MRVCVVIPVYNEEKIIKNTVDTVKEFLKSNENYSFIFVNDGSKDKSADIIEKNIKDCEKIKQISYEKNRGKGYAVRCGMIASDYDVTIFTDSDLAYGLDSVKRLGEKFENTDADIIVGSRNLEKSGYGEYTLLRRAASLVYIKVLSLFGGLRLSDSQCGIKGYRNPLAKKIFENCTVDGFAFDFESIMIAKKLNLKIEETPVKVKVHGDSKVHVIRDSLKMLCDLMKMKKRIKKLEIK